MPRKRLIVEHDPAAADWHEGKSPPSVAAGKPGPTFYDPWLDQSFPIVEPYRVADLSDVQELRVRLIRDEFCGEHEERQLARLERWVVTERVPLDVLADEVRRRFGPWPKPERDPKGRIVWTRREIDQLGPVARSAVQGSDRTVIVARGGTDARAA